MQKLYVIGPDTGPFKVGISSSPQKRLAALQTGNPTRLSVHFEMDSEDAARLEAKFHSAFEHARLSGEWFTLPLEAIREALENGFDVPEVEVSSGGIDGEAFTRWLADMKADGLARSDAAAARLLGVSANTVVALKREGADRRTALACAALLHRMEPYSV